MSFFFLGIKDFPFCQSALAVNRQIIFGSFSIKVTSLSGEKTLINLLCESS